MEEIIVKRRDVREITDGIFDELQTKYGDNDVVNGVIRYQNNNF